MHISCLEMEAVFNTVVHFLPQLENQNILIRSDNTTVVQYLNKKNGTHSPPLSMKDLRIWQLAIAHNIFLKAAPIAGKLNVLPDQSSRVQIRQTE